MRYRANLCALLVGASLSALVAQQNDDACEERRSWESSGRDHEDDTVSLLQARRQGGRSGRVKQSPDSTLKSTYFPLAWLHIPKTGTTFANALIRIPDACSGIPDDVVIKDERFSNPMEYHFQNEFPFDQYCPGLYPGPSTGFGSHYGIGDVYESIFKGHGVTMMRQPEQRIISAYNGCQHGVPMMTQPGLRMISAYGQCQHSWPWPHKPAGSLLEFAQQLRGCTVRMITRASPALNHPDYNRLPCGGPERATEQEIDLAKTRLQEGFVFVGLMEKWDLSICLVHTMFGGNCHSGEFVNNRPGSSSQGNAYDTSELGDFHDDADGELYKVAQIMFAENLARYNVSDSTCDWCYAARG